MRVVEDPAFQSLVEKKLGEDERLREAIKKMATKYVHTHDQYALVEGMRLAADFTQEAEPVLTVARLNQGLLVFRGDLSEVRAKVEALAPLPRKAAPEKVAVKMVLLRIGKLLDRVAQVNANRERMREERAKNPEAYKTYGPVGGSYPVAGELLTKSACEEYCQRLLLLNNSGSGNKDWGIDEAVKDLKQVLLRDEVTDAVVSEAWNRHVVREVLTS